MNVKMNSKGILVDYLKVLVKDTYDINSSSNFYDSKTHYYIGEYLRSLRDEKGIDLMHLYNLYSGNLIDNYRLQISNSTYSIELKKIDYSFELVETKSDQSFFDLVVIPIKPNTDYTVYIDTMTDDKMKGYPLYLTTMLYDGANFVNGDMYNPLYVVGSTYDKPFIYRVDLDTNYMTGQTQRTVDTLHLLIQVPKQCTKRLIVEGNYIDDINEIPIKEIKVTVPKDSFITNDKNSIALESKLVEYLTGYAITPVSSASNIELYQKIINSPNLLYSYGRNYGKEYNKGVFDDSIRNWLYGFQKEVLNNKEALGYIDKELELALMRVGAKDE